MNKETAINILRGDVLGTNEQTHEAVFMAIKALKEQKRVDAVEVVRCKDCRFFHRYGFKLEYAECVNFDFYDTTEDGYCCWAERREDETN